MKRSVLPFDIRPLVGSVMAGEFLIPSSADRAQNLVHISMQAYVNGEVCENRNNELQYRYQLPLSEIVTVLSCQALPGNQERWIGLHLLGINTDDLELEAPLNKVDEQPRLYVTGGAEQTDQEFDLRLDEDLSAARLAVTTTLQLFFDKHP